MLPANAAGVRQRPRNRSVVETPFAVSVLGGFDVCDRLDRALDGRALRRGSPMLKYLLAAPGHKAERARIAAALWPASPPAAAATNLRVSLHALKTALAGLPAIEARDGNVRLLPDHWKIDADVFERNAATALQARYAEEGDLLQLLKHYRGPFLGQDAETNWIAPRRLRLESLYRSLLLRYAQLPHAQYEFGLEAQLRHFLDDRPEDCEVASALAEILAARGQASEASHVRSVHRSATSGTACCREHIPPVTFTATTANSICSEPPALWFRNESPRFVGRAAEIARLGDLLDQAFDARGRTALLVGAPGIGKTRLAGETMAEAQDRGALVLDAACERSGGTTLRPFVRAIETVVEALSDTILATVLRSHGPTLARVSRTLRARIGLRDDDCAESVTDVSRIVPAAVAFFEELARLWPVVLLVEDLHAADPASVAAFSALAVTVPSMRFLLLGTARDAEFHNCLAADMLDAARCEVSLLRVGPLSGPESLALARDFCDSPLEPHVVARRAQGNPFAVLELSKGADGMRHIAGAVMTRIERLPAIERKVIDILALADPIALPEPSLARTIGQPVSEAIERLWVSGLLRRQPDGYTLAHGIFVEVIERLLDERDRMHVHAELAVLPEVQRHADAAAVHFLHAGPRYGLQAVSWSIRALDEAIAVRDTGSVLGIAQAAYALVAEGSPHRYKLAIGLGLAETYAGNSERAQDNLQHALLLAANDTERAAAYVALIELAETDMRVEEGLNLCVEAESVCRTCSPGDTRTIRSRRAFLLLLAGRFEEALSTASTLLDVGDPISSIRAGIVTAIAYAYRGRRAEAIQWFERAGEQAQRIGADREAALVKLNLASIHFHCGKLQSAGAEYRRAADYALSHGRLASSSISIRNAGECERYLGNFSEARACADVAERRAARSGRPMLVAEAQMLRGSILCDEGAFEAAFEAFERSAETFAKNADARLLTDASAHALIACWQSANGARPLKWIEMGSAASERCADLDTRAFFRVAASLAYLLLRDEEAARARLSLASGDLKAIGAVPRKLEVAVWCREAAAALGDPAVQQSALAQARALRIDIDARMPLLERL